MGAVLGLSKTLKKTSRAGLTLIDRHDYHLPRFMLPQALKDRSEEPNPIAIKKRAALPFEQILKGRNIRFIRGQAKAFGASGRRLAVSGKLIPYDCLIIATGSLPDFSEVAGAEGRAVPVQGLADVFRMRNQVEFAVQTFKFSAAQKKMRLVTIGGGWRGAVLAGAVKSLAEQVSARFGLKRSQVEIVVLESRSRAELDSKLLAALKKSGATVRYSSRAVSAGDEAVLLANGGTQPYNLLLWAGASRGAGLEGLVDEGGIKTDEHFSVNNFHRVYAVSSRPQGEYLARALPYYLNNRKTLFTYQAADSSRYPQDKSSLFGYITGLAGFGGALRYFFNSGR